MLNTITYSYMVLKVEGIQEANPSSDIHPTGGGVGFQYKILNVPIIKIILRC